ncbi:MULTISPECIES: class I SAM-dependent methyltransferase [Sphingomonas]|uniref:class I SAM-dependent methyltransferase n=1 Tax=Sphingomonas TaxID=13687 RepID=UPI000DEFFBF2|nr:MULTISPECIES: class I SAM-dependent methyltransferase [Sphingomonas]
MSFPDLFSGHAKLYAAARPTYPERTIAELAALAPGRGLAWDCGTGNGQAARLLAGHFASVVATDASAEQIAQAEPHDRVRFAVEAAEDCSLPDASCDLALAAQCIHWFDLDRFYAQVRRVLKPGGIVAALGYGWSFVDPEVDALVARNFLAPLDSYWAAGNRLIMEGYRTIPFPGEEVRLSPAAIHLAWTGRQFAGLIRSWSATQKLGEAALADAFAKLAALWPDDQQRHVVMPLVSRVARL